MKFSSRGACAPVLLSSLLAASILMPAAARAGWLAGGWSHRIELTARADQLQPGAVLTDIPLLVRIESDSLAAVFAQAKADGSDLVVTAADGVTPLAHELVSFDPVGQDAELWFRAPTLSETERVFYLYYGNPDTTITDPSSATWPSDHVAVLHFEDDPATNIAVDSGPHGNFAFGGAGSDWTTSDSIAGQIGRAWRPNGETDWIDGDNISSPDSSFTISAWFACWNQGQDANFAFSVEEGFWHLSAKRNSGQRNADFAAGGNFFRWNPVLPDTLLHHFVWTLDGVNDTIRFYFDGIERDGTRWAPNPPYKVYTGLRIQGNVGIGSPLFGQNNPFDMLEGIIDEFRVIEGVHGPQQVATEYRNQKDPVAFWVSRTQPLGTVTAVGPGTSGLARLRVWPNPVRGAAEISLEGVTGPVEVTVYDLAGRRVRRLSRARGLDGGLRLQWDGRDAQGRRVGSGVFFVRATGVDGVLASRKLLYVR